MLDKVNNISKILSSLYSKMAGSSIFFLIGVDGVYFAQVTSKKITKTIFCKNDDITGNQEIIDFLSSNKRYRSKIILSNPEIALEHQSLQVIESLANNNPVEKYCETHLHHSDLYSYKVYTIEKGAADNWKSLLLWSPITDALQKILSLIQEYDIVIDGFYFHDLAMQSIAQKIAEENNTDIHEAIYTTINTNTASGINININHKGNILDTTRIEYPIDKSDAYVQGVIEQALSDIWLKYKTYIEQNNLKKINFFLITQNLKNLLDHQNHNVDISYFASLDSDDKFADKILIEYFLKSTPQSASSREAKSYHSYIVLNSLIFKPFYLMMLIIVLYCGWIQFKAMKIDNDISDIYEKYTQLSEEVRLKAQDFPEISNIYEFADLYNVQKLLSQKKYTPFELISEIIKLENQDCRISDITWEQSSDLQKNLLYKFSFLITSTNKEDGLKLLESKISAIKEKYKNYDFDFSRNKSSNISDNDELVIILEISGRIE